MQPVSLKVYARDTKRKGSNRVIRTQGFAPGIIYGKDMEPLQVKVNSHDFTNVLYHSRAKEQSLLKLNFDNNIHEEMLVIIREVQHEPVTDDVVHVDFLHVPKGYTTNFKLPIEYIGEPAGIKVGGIVSYNMHILEVKGSPIDAPNHIEIEIEALQLGDAIHVRDIEVENVEIISPNSLTLVSVVAPKKSEMVLDEEEDEEGTEATEGGETEATPES